MLSQDKVMKFRGAQRFIRVAAGAVAALALAACGENTRYLPDDSGLAAFEEAAISGDHDNAWGGEFHPFIGAAPLDADGDGAMEIFVGGGDGHPDRLFAWRDGALRNVIAGTGLSDERATHGATSVDLDGDGDTDLLLARNDGVFFYRNDGGRFTRRQIPLTLPEDAVPFNVAVGDIDRDGDGDLYVSAFVNLANFRSATFNDAAHAKTNVLLRNDGDLRFTDITAAAGAASRQNTFLAAFMDLNDDGWADLIVAQNTGQVEFFRNRQDGTFAPVEVATGWGFWMGLAAGDIDADGDQDLFFTNSGGSIPAAMLEWIGDGRDDQPRNYGWLLLRNDGDFRFTDVTAAYGLDGYGFAWGAAFEDLTLDGELELLVAQNYIKWPFHHWAKLSGKSFVLSEGAYYHAPALNLENPAFAQAPLITDINGDGRPDVFWVNMEGGGRAFLNRSPGNFITLLFADTAAAVGARAVLRFAGGGERTREVHNNTGMSTDHAPMLTFGLGARDAVEEIVVRWPDGRRRVIAAPAVNQVIRLP